MSMSKLKREFWNLETWIFHEPLKMLRNCCLFGLIIGWAIFGYYEYIQLSTTQAMWEENVKGHQEFSNYMQRSVRHFSVKGLIFCFWSVLLFGINLIFIHCAFTYIVFWVIGALFFCLDWICDIIKQCPLRNWVCLKMI